MRRECPSPQEGCPYAEGTGCFSDQHHLYWPRTEYTTVVERLFRELPENKEQECRWEHEQNHFNSEPPIKPPREDMEAAIVASGIYLSIRKRRAIGGGGDAA